MTMQTRYCLAHCEKNLPFCVPEKRVLTQTHTDVQENPHSLQTPDVSFDFKVLRLALALIVAMKAQFKGLCASLCVCSQDRVGSD